MADVQLENGFIRLANDLYRAAMQAKLGDIARRTLLECLFRQYGWARKGQAPQPFTLSDSEVSESIGCSRSGGHRAMATLLDAGVLVCVAQSSGSRAGQYLVQKDFERWTCGFHRRPGSVTWTPKSGTRPMGSDPVVPQYQGTLCPNVRAESAPILGHKDPASPRGSSENGTLKDKVETSKRYSSTPTAREGGLATGPTDAGEVAMELWRMFAPRGPGGAPKPPSSIAQDTALTIVEVSGAERAREIALAVGRAGWGWSGFLRCFDDDGSVNEEEVPGARKRTGDRGKDPGGETREERQRRLYGE